MIRRLVCRMIGHRWRKLWPVEDRQIGVWRCHRCYLVKGERRE